MKVYLNINDQVTVKLTKEGATLYNAYISGQYPLISNDACRESFKEKGDELTTELWQIMSIFGSKSYCGGPQHFVDNILEIKG